jgi:hypothetical protein
MPNSRQTHIFATRSDLDGGLRAIEAKLELKYARCGLLYGPMFEQYFSLLEWKDLGKNAAGDHVTGPRFLVVLRSYEIKLEAVLQVSRASGQVVDLASKPVQNVIVCDEAGTHSKSPISLKQFLSDLEEKKSQASDSEVVPLPEGMIRYDLSPKLNPNSIVFSPGGLYENNILVCGHIGTAMKTPGSINLYKTFVRSVTRGFESWSPLRPRRRERRQDGR